MSFDANSSRYLSSLVTTSSWFTATVTNELRYRDEFAFSRGAAHREIVRLGEKANFEVRDAGRRRKLVAVQLGFGRDRQPDHSDRAFGEMNGAQFASGRDDAGGEVDYHTILRDL